MSNAPRCNAPRCYVAGKLTARFRLRTMRQAIRELGFVCHSAWMDSNDGDYPMPRERAVREAVRDQAEVAQADVFILDTLDESATGGREVELGYYLGIALALADPKAPARVVLVGPVRNIFHELAGWRCRDWSDGLEVLADIRQQMVLDILP